jgi:predicted nuclease of restriction endonuclease-like (RecB) superfamily
MSEEINTTQYKDILSHIIAEVKTTRLTVAHRLNTSMMQMYWNIGKLLSVEGLEKGYGANVVNRLSADLRQEFPASTGFSPRNLWDMKRFYEFYSLADQKLRQLAAVLPWMHNILILNKVKSIGETRFCRVCVGMRLTRSFRRTLKYEFLHPQPDNITFMSE